ncbi:YMGG-like glycine zipper-containing protein [Chryseobacterium sp. A301]
MKAIVILGAASVLMLSGCKKDETVAQKSLEQEKIEYQARQLEIERQKLAIEKEKMVFERAKDSIAKVESEKQAAVSRSATPVRERVVEKTVYRESPSSNSGTYAGGDDYGTYEEAPVRTGISKAAKGTIIGTVGGAAAGAIISKKNRGAGAVVGGIIGGATGYTIGRSQDRKDGRVVR